MRRRAPVEPPGLLLWMDRRRAVIDLPPPRATGRQQAVAVDGVQWATDGYAIWRTGAVDGADWHPMGMACALRPGEIEAAIEGGGGPRLPATLNGERIAWEGGSMPVPSRHRALLALGSLWVELAPWAGSVPSPGAYAALLHLEAAGIATAAPETLRPVCIRVEVAGETLAIIGAVWEEDPPPPRAVVSVGACDDPDGGGSRDWASPPFALAKPSVLAIVGTSKWLSVSVVSIDMVIDHKVVVVCLPTWRAFALLQSVVHNAWARFAGLHSSMQTTARYTTSTIFETLPFPRPCQEALDELDALGQDYHALRVWLQRTLKLGLTKLLNRVYDPAEGCPWVLELRDLQTEIDCAVLDCYGWQDIEPPDPSALPPCIEAAGGRPIPPAMAEITRRLRRLNAKRAREERE